MSAPFNLECARCLGYVRVGGQHLCPRCAEIVGQCAFTPYDYKTDPTRSHKCPPVLILDLPTKALPNGRFRVEA